MAFKLPNRVRMSITGTPGTGDVALNVATSGYQTLLNAGLSNGDTFPYVIEDGANWELGVGTYNSSGPSFARTTVRASSGGGTSKISATSNAVVFSSIMGEDVGSGGSGPGTIPILVPPVAASLASHQVLGGATLTQRTTDAIPSLSVVSGGSDNNIYVTMEAAPGGDFSLVTKVRAAGNVTHTSWHGAGLAVYNSGNGHYASTLINPALAFFSIDWTSGSGGTVHGPDTLPDTEFFQHIDYDGTLLKYGYSRNGVDVFWTRTENMVSAMGAITDVGIAWYSDSTVPYDFEHYHVGAQGTSGITLY